MVRQMFKEESMSRTGCLNGKSKLTKSKKGKTGEEQSQEHVDSFLTSRGLCTRNLS
jgi:hypothetical protein